MAAEMLQRVLNSEKESELIINEAYSKADDILRNAEEQADKLRIKMLENARAQHAEIENDLLERAQFALIDAEKRAELEADKIKSDAARIRSQVILRLMKEVSKG